MQRALAKDPVARFGSANELARALARAWAEVAVHPPAKADIHNEATRVWQRPTPAASQPSNSVPAAPAGVDLTLPHTAPQLASLPAPIQQAQPQLAGARSRLGVLGALLAVLLLAGVVLAARGAARTTERCWPTAGL